MSKVFVFSCKCTLTYFLLYFRKQASEHKKVNYYLFTCHYVRHGTIQASFSPLVNHSQGTWLQALKDLDDLKSIVLKNVVCEDDKSILVSINL